VKARFSIFLNNNPTYLGFTPVDLVLLAIGLFLGMIFKTSTLVGSLIGLGFIYFKKLLVKKNIGLYRPKFF
jgi:hypothetical protein